MDLQLEGRRALVLGASDGLGKAIAAALAQEGARVAICSRDSGRLEVAAKEIRAQLTVAEDLSRPAAGRRVVERVLERWQGLDILVTNAGGPPKGRFDEVSDEQWQAGFQGLYLSAVDAIQAALPGMRKQKWGRILLITSDAAKEPMPGLTISNGLRAGLLGLAKSLSREVAAEGVTVNCLLPGFINTDRLRQLGISSEKMSGQIPAGRLGDPQELANVAAFLASTRASYVTGQAIAVDGGYLQAI